MILNRELVKQRGLRFFIRRNLRFVLQRQRDIVQAVQQTMAAEIVDFEGLPDAVTRMRDRGTTGRTIVRVG